MHPKTTTVASNLRDLPESQKTYLPYTAPKLIVLDMLTTENQPGSGGDGTGYPGHDASG